MAAKNDVHTLEGEKKLAFNYCLGGEDWGFGGEDSPPVDETPYQHIAHRRMDTPTHRRMDIHTYTPASRRMDTCTYIHTQENEDTHTHTHTQEMHTYTPMCRRMDIHTHTEARLGSLSWHWGVLGTSRQWWEGW